ncbi:MAG: hypothetical protein ABF545_09390 [Bifidobacterium psychraerophilum]|uniref:hypothetical protein n=1 Tax=Bifidobacterium psychraerophilum TaxID=218140 RepID=UPI0039E848B9
MAKNVIQFGFDSKTANQHKEGTIKAGVATVKVLESWGGQAPLWHSRWVDQLADGRLVR